MKILGKLIINMVAITLVAYLLPAAHIDGFWAAFWAALVLGLVNVLIKPLLILLTLPITILTLGLFLLVINALAVLITSALVPGFEIAGFWWAMLFSVILSILNSILTKTVSD